MSRIEKVIWRKNEERQVEKTCLSIDFQLVLFFVKKEKSGIKACLKACRIKFRITYSFHYFHQCASCLFCRPNIPNHNLLLRVPKSDLHV